MGAGDASSNSNDERNCKNDDNDQDYNFLWGANKLAPTKPYSESTNLAVGTHVLATTIETLRSSCQQCQCEDDIVTMALLHAEFPCAVSTC